MVRIGSVHGRFQVLHYEHMEYILEAKKRCEHLIVGITNFDGRARSENPNDLRSCANNNPLNYFDRSNMIRLALLEEGICGSSFSCSPFPIEDPSLLPNFIDRNVLCFTTLKEAWNKQKVEILGDAGYKVEVLMNGEKRVSATDVRAMIRSGGNDWKNLVPKSVAEYIVNEGLLGKIKNHGKFDSSE